MTPHSDRGDLNDAKLWFNFALSRCHLEVENEFDRLKGRFQYLIKGIVRTIEPKTLIVCSCIILHKFCIIANKSTLKNGDNELTRIYRSTKLLHNSHPKKFSEIGGDSEGIRNSIKHSIANKYDKLWIEMVTNTINTRQNSL